MYIQLSIINNTFPSHSDILKLCKDDQALKCKICKEYMQIIIFDFSHSSPTKLFTPVSCSQIYAKKYGNQ